MSVSRKEDKLMKKLMLLIPENYKMSNIEKILPFYEIYKDVFDIKVLVENPHLYPNVDINELIDSSSDYATYLIFTADFVIDAGAVKSFKRKESNAKWISIGNGVQPLKNYINGKTERLEEIIEYSYKYDIMFSNSDFYSENYLRNELYFENKIEKIGFAYTDNIIIPNAQRIEDFKKRYNISNDKKIILYINDDIDKIELNFDNLIDDKTIFLIRAINVPKKISNNPNIINISDYIYLSDLINIADVLISNYSKYIIDFSLVDKPIILFDKEINNLNKVINLYDYLKSDVIISEEKKLKYLLNNEIVNDNKKLRNKFMPLEDGNTTKDIKNLLKLEESQRIKNDMIFLVDRINDEGGVKTFIANMAKYYKQKYNCRIFLISFLEVQNSYSEIYYFENENIDFSYSLELDEDIINSIIKYNNGIIIATQLSVYMQLQKLLKDKMVILMIHTTSKVLINDPKNQWYWKNIANENAYNYDKLLFLSQKDADYFKEHVDKEHIREKIGYMNNSIGLNYHQETVNKANIFVFLGRLSAEKNPLFLVEIGKEIKTQNLDFKINIYGDGPLKEELIKAIKDNNLENILILKGFESDKNIVFKNTKGLLLTSHYEGFPMVILEAYAYGKPIISVDSYFSVTDIIEDGISGYIVETDNAKEFVDRMKLVENIKNEDIYNNYQKFTNDNIFNEWNNLFEKIADENKSTKINENISVEKEIKKTNIADNKSKSSKAKSFLRKIKKRVFSKVTPNKNTSTQKPLTNICLYYQQQNDYDYKKAKKEIEKNNYINITTQYVDETNIDYNIINSNAEYFLIIRDNEKLVIENLPNILKYLNKNNKKIDVLSFKTSIGYKNDSEENIWIPNIYNKNIILNNSQRYLEYGVYKDCLSSNKIIKRDIYLKNEWMNFLVKDADIFNRENAFKLNESNLKIGYYEQKMKILSYNETNLENLNKLIESTNYFELNKNEIKKGIWMVTLAGIMDFEFVNVFRNFDEYDRDNKDSILNLFMDFYKKNTSFYYDNYIENALIRLCIDLIRNSEYTRLEELILEYSKQECRMLWKKL